MSTSYSPCAACKCLRRKCDEDCVFAPYFPPEHLQKFISVHKVYGASNVGKILKALNADKRQGVVKALTFEADCMLRDPLHGCVGIIGNLQHQLEQIQQNLYYAKTELATYIGPSAMLPFFQHPSFIQQHPNNPSMSAVMPYNMQPMMGLPTGVTAASHGAPLMIREPQQQQQHQQHQQTYEAQQLSAEFAAEQQEMFRTYEQQQPPAQELLRFNTGFDAAFNLMTAAAMVPSLDLGSFEVSFNQIPQQQEQLPPPPQHSHSQHHHHKQLQLQEQLMLEQKQQLMFQQQSQPQLPPPQHSHSQHHHHKQLQLQQQLEEQLMFQQQSEPQLPPPPQHSQSQHHHHKQRQLQQQLMFQRQSQTQLLPPQHSHSQHHHHKQLRLQQQLEEQLMFQQQSQPLLPPPLQHSHSQHHHHKQLQLQQQLMLEQKQQLMFQQQSQPQPPQQAHPHQPQATQQQTQIANSEECRSVGPSC